MLHKAILVITTIIMSSFVLMGAANFESDIISENVITLNGSVVDATTGEGIEGAEVTLQLSDENQSQDVSMVSSDAEVNMETTITDANGMFMFEEVEMGSYNISVEAEGYNSYEDQLEISEEESTVTIELEPEYLEG